LPVDITIYKMCIFSFHQQRNNYIYNRSRKYNIHWSIFQDVYFEKIQLWIKFLYTNDICLYKCVNNDNKRNLKGQDSYLVWCTKPRKKEQLMTEIYPWAVDWLTTGVNMELTWLSSLNFWVHFSNEKQKITDHNQIILIPQCQINNKALLML